MILQTEHKQILPQGVCDWFHAHILTESKQVINVT